MFSIGEFSRVSGLTVKALRFYHERGVLLPTHVEAGSGYRFYSEAKIETARVIVTLRDLGFSVSEIGEIVSQHDEDADLVEYLEAQRDNLKERLATDRRTLKQLSVILNQAREAAAMKTKRHDPIERKTIEPMRIARIRMTGKYSDCGEAFGRIGRSFGRSIVGPAMMLNHDDQYREDDATFDAALPVKAGESTADIVVEELPGGACISLTHIGRYEDLGQTYAKLLKYASDNSVEYELPTREIYRKGPGMIFRGNPAKYVTEVQLMVRER